MNTPPLSCRTTARVDVRPDVNMRGGVDFVVAVKQAFHINADGQIDPAYDTEIYPVDVPWDDGEDLSSVRYPVDLQPPGPGTDVIVNGSAVARDREPHDTLDVLVRVGPLQRALRVFGPRVWYQGATGMVPTPPEKFTEQPLRWEHAFGGREIGEDGASAEEPRNPLGKGVALSSSALNHQPVPSVEDPVHLIRTHRTRPPPAGVGVVPVHFAPRLAYAGTMDQAWEDTRMPLRPLDFDPRFYQAAVPELTSETPLRGGELVELLNLSDAGPMRFHLPKKHFFVGGRVDRRLSEARATLSTVLFDMDDMKMHLTWRACVPCPRPAGRMTGLLVFEKRVLS